MIPTFGEIFSFESVTTPSAMSFNNVGWFRHVNQAISSEKAKTGTPKGFLNFPIVRSKRKMTNIS